MTPVAISQGIGTASAPSLYRNKEADSAPGFCEIRMPPLNSRSTQSRGVFRSFVYIPPNVIIYTDRIRKLQKETSMEISLG